MSENFEQTRSRLENIQSIEPLISTMRTISLANWRHALTKHKHLTRYIREIEKIFLSTFLIDGNIDQTTHGTEKIIIAIGSNQGLCGNFNREIVRFIKEAVNSGYLSQSKIIIVGDRLKKIFNRHRMEYYKYFAFSSTSPVEYKFICELWSQMNQPAEKAIIEVVYNQYQSTGKYYTVTQQVFPYSISSISEMSKMDDKFIFDTAIDELREYLGTQLSTLTIYSAFLASNAAENSTRYQLMEEASKNAAKLTEELNIELQIHRRQKITSEMQELAISAGLLKNK